MLFELILNPLPQFSVYKSANINNLQNTKIKSNLILHKLKQINDGIIGLPLTASNEDLINNSESVIQVINPAEEESASISFSLLNEIELQDYYRNQELAIYDYEYPTMNSERTLR